MSVPTCAPAKVWRCELLQLLVAVLITAPPWVETPTEFEVELMFTWPPTPRAHTPPPGWSGAGSAGADTKALPCWVRNAVLTLPIAAEMAAAVALVGIASVPMLVIVNGVATWVVVQFWNDVVVGGGAWANAAGAARTKPARPAQASKPE